MSSGLYRAGAYARSLLLVTSTLGCVPDVVLREDAPDGQADADALDPECIGGETRPGVTACGLNRRGFRQMMCQVGKWVETDTCIDPDACRDGAARGNCADESAEACVAGAWSAADCVGCGVVDCAATGPTCCAGLVAFVLDTPANGYRGRDDLVESFTTTTDAVAASYTFDAAGQRGMIGFDLAAPMEIKTLRVNATSSGAAGPPYVSLESAFGVDGCTFALISNAIDVYGPMSCWGSFNFKLTSRINVRVDSSAAASARLSVQSVVIN
jgi:hypothetical protein